jgi:hypothetical protein
VKFSEHFRITRTASDDWFDPVLTLDTKLFVDPFLIYAQPFGPFVNAHAKVIAYFNHVFQLIAASRGAPGNSSWLRATNLLIFPEVSELCLGYTTADVRGAGAAHGFATIIAEAMWEAVQAGIIELRHFEEVGLLREGLGADRISDMTANVLRAELVEYTQEIATRHRIPTVERHISRLHFSEEFSRWLPDNVRLPINPSTREPVLLVPERFLRDLPTISGEPFWDYCFDHHNEVLRAEFGEDVSRNVDKRSIVNTAQRHPDFRKEFVESTERSKPAPYDLKRDVRGRFVWYDATLAHCRAYPLRLSFQTAAEFRAFVGELVLAYQKYIEDNSGWRLLWNDNGKPKSEEATQLTFLGIVKHYCAANEVSIAKESDLGRGPSDFTFAQGHTLRSLIETKLAKNTKFWHGLERQLPTYMRAEGIEHGVFVVVLLTERDRRRVRGILETAARVSKDTGYAIDVSLVDATPDKPSASRV